MKNKIADEIRLKHIFDAIESIEIFISNSDFDKFLSNKMLHSAGFQQNFTGNFILFMERQHFHSF